MIFELLFLAFLFASIVAVIGGVAALVRGARRKAARILLGLCVSWAVYLAIVAIVSATTPQHIVAMGEDRCFDEMCFTVVHAATAPELGPSGQPVKARGIFYLVTIRVKAIPPRPDAARSRSARTAVGCREEL